MEKILNLNYMIKILSRTTVFILVLLSLAAGCSSNRNLLPASPGQESTDYLIGPGDNLDMVCFPPLGGVARLPRPTPIEISLDVRRG